MTKTGKNKRLYWIIGVALGVVLLLVVAKRRSGDRGIEVTVDVAEVARIVEQVSASGTVQPVVEVKISPEVSGEIIALAVEEGDSVIKGQLLLKIRPDNFQSARDRAVAAANQQRANLESAKANFSRTKAAFIQADQDFSRQQELFEKKVISEADFQAAQASYQIAREDRNAAEQSVEAAKYVLRSANATVAEANENLELTTIRSPMNGIVSKLSVEEGETVVGTSQMQGTEMLRIADLTEMEVRVDVNENDIIRLKEGDTAIIDVDAYSYLNKEFKGQVTQIANTAKDKISDDAITEFEVRLLILNRSYRSLITEEGIKYPFRPGMTAGVDIITKVKDRTLSVPISSVTTRPDPEDTQESAEVVFMVGENKKAVMQKVTTGISDFERIEILDGLKSGDRVITGPFTAVATRLQDDDAVQFKTEKIRKKASVKD